MRPTPIVCLVCLALTLTTVPAVAQNLLANPDFDTMTLSPWDCDESQGTASWDSRDTTGAPGSGSMRLDNQAPAANATVICTQCVPVTAYELYQVSTSLYFDGNVDGSARVNISFFSQADCSFSTGTGDNETQHAIPGTNTDQWLSLTNDWSQAPAGTVAAVVRVISWADTMSSPTTVHFDGIELEASGTLLFADGFESGDPSDWSSSTPGAR